MPGEHARLSPSAADRWFICPGAPNAEHGLPDAPSPAASEGTTAHTLLETALGARQAPADCTDIPGVNPEMMQHVTAAWRLAAGMQAGCDRFAIEMKVDPGSVFNRDDLWGTSDIVIEHGNHLTVLDFKYGRWPVDPANSKQLQIYAIGAAAQSLQRIESFTLGIIQPRTAGPPLKLWQVDRDGMTDFARQLKAAAAATDDPEAQRIPGDHCKFCRARSTCPEYGG
jgi:hypothetical protein